jgi:hypothetical protein
MAAVMQQQSSLLLRTSDMMLEIRPGQNARHASSAANPDPNKGYSGTASGKAGELQQSPAPVAEPATNPAGGETKGALHVTRAGRVMLHIPLHDSRTTDFAPKTAPAAKTQHKKRSVS